MENRYLRKDDKLNNFIPITLSLLGSKLSSTTLLVYGCLLGRGILSQRNGWYELVESIKAKGVLSPAIARKRPEGGFELISGHRRTHAARRAGLDKIPVFVKDYSDDEVVCIMVDSNIQRTGTSFGMVS